MVVKLLLIRDNMVSHGHLFMLNGKKPIQNVMIPTMKRRNMCLFRVTIACLILQYFTYCDVDLIDYANLMKNYYLLCGPDYFCFEPSITHQWNISPNLSYRQMNVCPDCRCDNACIKRGDCCADLYFSFPDLKCVNRTIINGRFEQDHTEQTSALMVTSCPEESKHDIKEKCALLTDIKSQLRNFPVTGRHVPLTFYNKYCAECHGITNYTVWTLDINCSVFADFNFLSSIDEVIDLAFDKKCILQAFHEDHFSGELKQENCFDIDEDQTLFTKCNQTGEWLNFDSNIAHACESFYKSKYRIFKNVFCYMCNPSGLDFISNDTYSTCNITGQWKIFDRGLEQGCLDLPKTPTTLPFKNIFCYLCNRGNDSSQMFVDVFGQFEEFPIYDRHFLFQYNFSITGFNMEFFTHASQSKIEENQTLFNIVYDPFDIDSFKTNDGLIINITSLLLHMSGMEELKVCNSRNFLNPKGYNPQCICEISCLFDRKNLSKCCKDLSIQVPLHCRDSLVHHPFSLHTNKGVPTIKGCFQETTRYMIKKGCTQAESGDIFSQIPLTKSNGVNYDNFYCVLCNIESDELVMKMKGHLADRNVSQTSAVTDDYLNTDQYTKSRSDYTIWNLEIVCPTYLDYSHFLNSGILIEIAKELRCRIRFIKETTGLQDCSLPRGSKSRCADEQNWTYSDPDVEWACNNLMNYGIYPADILPKSLPKIYDTAKEKSYRNTNGAYTNIFCTFCKPERKFPEFFIDNCTVYNSYFCFYYPRIYYYYPFKNIHCVTCNGIYPYSVLSTDPGGELDLYNPAVGITWFPILRNMFSISGDVVTDHDVDTAGQTECNNDQVYDQYKNICRNITCYNGKYLFKGKCLPLLDRTMNLQYTMILMIETYRIKKMILNMTSLNEALIQKIHHHIYSKLNVKADIKLKGNEKLSESGKNSLNHCMFFEVNLLFRCSVSRLLVEQSLVDLKYQFEDSCSRNVKRSNDNNHIEKMERTKKRFIDNPFSNGFYSAKVSNVLLCPQIELDDVEFNVSDDSFVLTLTRDGFGDDVIKFDEFAMTPNGRMRVCLEYLQNINYIPISHQAGTSSFSLDIKKKYLWIFSLVSSVVSIICLSLGLICYLILPSLQTIPGKLIILLMASLLFTLIFLQISYFAVRMEYGCIVVAIVSHFSWLTVFMCTQTANFHMWRTFTSIEVYPNTSDRVLIKYFTYVLGVPMGLICVNLILGWAFHSDPFAGYGGGQCFLRHTYSLIVLFICPVALICLTNVLFFCLTARTIKLTPRANCNQRKRNELVIFARLTTVTGVSWSLQIIDSFLPFTYFTFFSTILNSLQGFFIFVAFILNKRVWGLLHDRLCLTDYTKTMQAQSKSNDQLQKNFK